MSNQNIAQISPLDTLFFRSGKPFTKGEDSWIDNTSVIPNPSVFWGAMFTSLYANDIARQNDITDKITELSLKGIFIFNKNTDLLLVPAPLDLFLKKDEKFYYAEEYEDVNKNIIANNSTNILVQPNEEKELITAENYYINFADLFQSYTDRHSYRTKIYSFDDFAFFDPKVGNTRLNETHAAENSMLYKTQLLQFDENWCYIVKYESKQPLDNVVLKLGGEGKTAKVEDLQNFKMPENKENQETEYFKVYFQNPVIWKSGDGLEEMQSLPNCELLTACIGKPLHIGGWDYKERKPKTMRKAVPAGSVYLLKGDMTKAGNEIERIIKVQNLNTSGFGIYHLIPFKTN